jgi:hypothetical protein
MRIVERTPSRGSIHAFGKEPPNASWCLERLALLLDCAASCEDESLPRRPEKQDRRSRRARHVHLRGRLYFRRGHLLGQASRPGLRERIIEAVETQVHQPRPYSPRFLEGVSSELQV